MIILCFKCIVIFHIIFNKLKITTSLGKLKISLKQKKLVSVEEYDVLICTQWQTQDFTSVRTDMLLLANTDEKIRLSSCEGRMPPLFPTVSATAYTLHNCVIHIYNIFQIEQDAPVNEANPHIANIGRMVEDMENKIRHTLSEIYFSKTKDIVNSLRSVQPLSESAQQQALKLNLAVALQRRQNKSDN